MNKEKMYSCKEEAEKRIKYLNSPKFSGEARVHVGEYYLITDLQKLKRKLKKKDSHNKNGDKNAKTYYGLYDGPGVSRGFWNRVVVPGVLRANKNTCIDCKITKKKLQIHHEDYVNQNINTLIPLCRSCHKKRHGENLK